VGCERERKSKREELEERDIPLLMYSP
jgi:hypothetical protein